MFTGVIKLAQIDDYISPSQTCIQPKIMKNDHKDNKATVTLNDCLACSGCITSAESILIEQMSINKFIEYTRNQESPLFLVISPQSLLSLSKYYKVPIGVFASALEAFLSESFPQVKGLFELSTAIDICHQLILKEFLGERKENKLPIICSECPGWVCYAEKTLTEAVTRHMSKIKSPQQIMGNLMRQKFGKSCRIVTIMPCYDKKLEAIRFEIEQGIKEVDLTLSTTELLDLIQQRFGKEENEKFITAEAYEKGADYKFTSVGNNEREVPISFIKDQTSNGYIDLLISKLNAQDCSVQQVRNSDFQEFTFKVDGEIVKMAKCYGFRNIQKAVQGIKKGKCPYQYIEMMACPGGCFSGGGQIRYEGVKNKEVIEEMKEIQSKYELHEPGKECRELGELLKDVDVCVEYKPIEKSLTESVMNW